MQPTQNTQEEILVLETEISQYKALLDQSISDDEVLEKTRAIFHDLKILTERLAELKKSAVLNKGG